MDFLNSVWDAEAHKQVYVAMLRTALNQLGDIGKFAESIGISRVYLEYLLDTSYNRRNPSKSMAVKIANGLPIGHEQRDSLIEHMILCREKVLRTRSSFQKKYPEQALSEQLREIRADFYLAANTTEPSLTLEKYKLIRDRCYLVLKLLDYRASPLTFVDICYILHNVQCVLDRPDEALFYSKIAHSLMASLDQRDHRMHIEDFEHLYVRSINAEALSYSNLGLDKQAYTTYLEADFISHCFGREVPQTTIDRYINMLKTYSNTKRFSIKEARRFATIARRACEHFEHTIWPQTYPHLIDRALSIAYLHYGKSKEGRRLLEPYLDVYGNIPSLSFQVSFLKTYMLQLHKEGDYQQFLKFAIRAHTLAKSAGMLYHLRMIESEIKDAIILTPNIAKELREAGILVKE